MTSTAAGRKIVEEKFRIAFDSYPGGMIMVDAAGTILVVNAELEKLFQYRREELVGQPIKILVPPRYRSEIPQLWKSYHDDPGAQPTGRSSEAFGLRKDGTEVPIEIRLNPAKTQDGGVAILGAINDISERNRNDQLKDEFVAMVSHELRTPMTSIAASLGLLIADPAGKLSDPAKRLLKIAHSNSQRLVRLINDILDMEKIESGKVDFQMKRLKLRSIVEQTVEGNRGFADQFGVNVRLDPESTDAVVRADIDRLTQVVTNLLSNAVKHSPRGGEVMVAIKNCGANARISVRDHGPGIPEEFKSRIFERFAQANSSNGRQQSGTGLGLSIVKQIVSKLGGETGFEAAPGGGTIFYVDLPSCDHRSIPDLDHETVRILLCDDDHDSAINICGHLQRAGFDTDVAYTANEAVRGAATRSYAAILVDLQSAESDGIALIKQLRSQWYYQNTPIIVAAADSERDSSERQASTLNVLDWLSKPVDVERLARILNRPIIRDAHPRPRILHFEDDKEVSRLVSDALKSNSEIVSVVSIAQARQALAAQNFDLAVIDAALANGECGLDLLPLLHGKARDPIPVVVFSPRDMPGLGLRLHSALTKSRACADDLVAILRGLVTSKPGQVTRIKVVA